MCMKLILLHISVNKCIDFQVVAVVQCMALHAAVTKSALSVLCGDVTKSALSVLRGDVTKSALSVLKGCGGYDMAGTC